MQEREGENRHYRCFANFFIRGILTISLRHAILYAQYPMKTVGIEKGGCSMRLSTRGKYGLYAMIYLAQHAGEGPQALKAIAELGLPDSYLEQLLGSLRRAGLVTTVRGAQGGYQLSCSPDQITVKHIIEAMEGPLNLSECVGEPETACPRGGNCAARGVWAYLTDEINGLLSSITLTDMVNQNIKGDV